MKHNGANQNGKKPANFADDLAWSQAQSDQSFWGDVYRQSWPDMASMTIIRKDGWAQRGGIDRSVTLHSGRTYTIDEKARRKKWPDILLELQSDIERKTPGWIVKDLACDFIAYAFVPTRECYLLPVAALQRAWRKHGEIWLREYKTRTAENEGWQTLNCPVPIPILMRKISEAMYFRWQEEKGEQSLFSLDDPVLAAIDA
jgi:hypothetical protein